MLIIGKDKSDLFRNLPEPFLFIGDNSDLVSLPKNRKVTRLDLSKHSFNPLENIDYRKARDFITVLNSVFPEGDNTLTRRASNYELLKALIARPKKLALINLGSGTGSDDARIKIDTLLLSPVLKRFLCNPATHTNFSLDGILIAELNRSKLTDFDAFVIGNLLIASYKGHVVVPDFGFYACPFHVSLMREGRLIAGVNFLDEAKDLKDNLLLMDNKRLRSATVKDAETIATYEGILPHTNEYNDFIAQSIA